MVPIYEHELSFKCLCQCLTSRLIGADLCRAVVYFVLCMCVCHRSAESHFQTQPEFALERGKVEDENGVERSGSGRGAGELVVDQ